MLSRSTSRLLLHTTTPLHMKVAVGVKRVVDYTQKVRVQNNKIITDNLKLSVNPFCEIAIEEAVRLKEKKIVTEVVAVLVGSKKSEEALRSAVALGADEAIHVVLPDDQAAALEPLAVAQVLAKIHEQIKPELWILGKQAIDGDFGITPQMLAALINASQGTFASAVEVSNGKVTVTREIDAGRQKVELKLPAVLAADLRLNTPRFASLPNIMKARKKAIKVIDGSTLGVNFAPHLEVLKVEEPKTRAAGVKVKDVDELVSKLRNEAKVI